MGSLDGNRLHVAAWISWHRKAAKLSFYNDEESVEITLPNLRRPMKPRKSRYQSDESFDQELKAWAAMKCHIAMVKSKGNSMTQEYYTSKILPECMETIQKLRRDHTIPQPRTLTDCHDFMLQEDNNGSHGHCKPGPT